MRKLFLWTCAAVFLRLPDSAAQEQRPLQLEDRREIFVDTHLIGSLHNVRMAMHTPQEAGVAFYFDKPWEGRFSGYVTVIQDGGRFRAYYRGEPVAGKDGNAGEVTCLAESADGKTWQKPLLQQYVVAGHKRNNVVLAHATPASHNFSPFLDKNPAAPAAQRYKAFSGTRETGLLAYASADGIRWEKMQAAPVITKGAFDSQNVVFWSESERQYVCYFRTMTAPVRGERFRSVSRSVSKDFLHWSEPEEMQFGNTPMEHLYTQQTSPYFRAPHIYLAIGARFMPNRQVVPAEEARRLKVDPAYYKDCSDVVLMATRGGNVYSRTFMESFIRPGIGLDNWVSRSNYPALNVVQTGPDELSLFVNEAYAQPGAHLKRYTLRLDGFASLNAPYAGGEVITKAFTFSGRELEINYATSAAGGIRIEMQDAEGTPLPGFTMEDATTIIGNETKRVVRWKGSADVSALAGKTVRLKIHMKDADLYALKFNK
ncbi:hypothetical protein [Chitinophaga sp.]|uniref:hypothetical protein n=1 Tax=Chitinophaga sp. TaxID=1869181 RepID=UPI0031DFC4D7